MAGNGRAAGHTFMVDDQVAAAWKPVAACRAAGGLIHPVKYGRITSIKRKRTS
jgi:hypothetical protein